MSILIHPIKAFNDNYIWTLINDSNKQAIVIDPGQSAPVIAYLEEHELELTSIWTTHHHRWHGWHRQGHAEGDGRHSPETRRTTRRHVRVSPRPHADGHHDPPASWQQADSADRGGSVYGIAFFRR